MRRSKPLRMKSWYWGKFVLKPLANTSLTDYEEYVEERHGWHHSEEFQSGYRTTPYDRDERRDGVDT